MNTARKVLCTYENLDISIKSTHTFKKISEGVGEIVQQVDALSVQADNLSMSPRMHGRRRESTLKDYSDSTTHCPVCACF